MDPHYTLITACMLLHLPHDAAASPSFHVTVVNLLPVSPIVRSRKVSWERRVSIMTRLDDPAFDFRMKQHNFSSKCPDRLWGPSCPLFNGDKGERGISPWGLSGWGVKLITHIYLVPRVKISRVEFLSPYVFLTCARTPLPLPL